MNFWGRFVFGFLLAQVLPGILCTFFLFFISVGGKIISTTKVMGYADYLAVHAERMAKAPIWLFCFLIGATCLGIVIHWTNWMVLGRLEQKAEAEKLRGIDQLPWHRRPFWVQVILWPVDLVREYAILFLGTPSFDKVIRRERITLVPPERFPQVSWLEEYYMPFAHFLTNLQIALLPALISVFVVFSYAGFTLRRVLFLLLTYTIIGLTRMLARQQVISVMRAEMDLIEGIGKSSKG